MHLKTLKQKKNPSSLKKVEFTFSEKELPSFFKKNEKLFLSGAFFSLKGELGAGKSTFVKAFFQYLDFKKNYQGSPTFPLLFSYRFKMLTIIHCDCYRLNSPMELEASGISENLIPDKNKVVFCEWLDKFPAIKKEFKKIARKNKINFLEVEILFDPENIKKRILKIDYAAFC